MLLENFENPGNIFMKSVTIFGLFLFYHVQEENVFTIEIEYGRKVP